MLECVPNVSEGTDRAVLDDLARACGRSLLDVHSDADHHRSVFTLAGPGPLAAESAVRALASAVAGSIDIAPHEGVHPRLGALDVVPFVTLDERVAGEQEAVRAAHDFARWWSETHAVPCFLYDTADPHRSTLPSVRRDAFVGRAPDHGPAHPHPRLGATAVGVRRPLVALNCALATPDVGVARRIAARIRESNGGLPGVRALGLELASQKRAQVSMNLVALERTGIEDAATRVRDLARDESVAIHEVELVGLAPRAALTQCSAEFLEWSRLDPTATIEDRLAGRDE